jgi:hypothetical protein
MQPQMENASQLQGQASGGMTAKAAFNAKYWFGTLQMVTVVNPLEQDWPFMVEMRHYIIKKGAKERFPGVIANVYLDQMSKILAQHDEQLGNMADPELKKIYYDKLIVSVDSLVQEHDNRPAYLQHVAPEAMLGAPDEVAPWERASQTPVASPEPPKAPAKPEAGERSFDLNGLKFKMVTDEAGLATFFKNDKEIDEAAYAKAASMA